MRGLIPLDKLSIENLREIVDVMERRADGSPCDTAGWSREDLITYIESLRPAPRKIIKKKKRRGTSRMAKNLGVGRYCVELLGRVIGRDLEDHAIGFSYKQMVKMAQKKFPDSLVDERHLRWYAAKARRDGFDIPAYRERSKWQ